MGWVRFSIVRAAVFAALFVTSSATICLLSWQASMFLNNQYDKPYIIFGLIVSILSIFASAGLSARYDFHTHIGSIALFAVLWLAFASYTTDRIGYVQCESLEGTRRPKTGGGTFSNVAWCSMMKALMAFGWFNFGLLFIAVISWIRLQESEEELGEGSRRSSRRESFRAAEAVNYANAYRPGVAGGQFPVGTYPAQFGGIQQPTGQVVYQQPGHNVVVQNGQIRQVPVGAPVY